MSALSAALGQACRCFGSAVAVVGGPIQLAYAEPAEHARAVASLLQDAGLDADEPVPVHASNQPHDIVALFGVWLSGGATVPVHRATPAAVAAMVHERTKARFLLDLESTRIETA